ncbi:MAG TPA: alanine racemase [Candidatus Limnocylindria bacterium]|jgi:alanine racemase|nr:alanine racemase [Candidatus Limnocylindria bacterium]
MTVSDALRSTVADVDLDAIAANIGAIKARANAEVIAVVKADAYGHGAEAIAETCFEAGAVMVAVASVEEGLALREAGVNGPILVLLGATDSSEVAHAVAQDLVLVVWDVDRARAISEAATALRRDARVHVKVDTGLTRLGAPAHEATARYRAIGALPHIEIDGIFTHFATADDLDVSNDRAQLAKFREVLGSIADRPRLVHAAASAGLAVFGPIDGVNAVRPGIAVYGVHPAPHLASALDLRPALSWRSRVHRIASVPAGTGVSYGHEYRLPRDGRIATVPVGYGDGLPRVAGKSGTVLLRGRRVPFAGRICMDLVMIDVTDIDGAREGDDVTLIGTQAGETQTADDLAAACGTINYEILTGIRRRVPRRYFRGGKLVATRTLAEGYHAR